jgi:peptide/nickel transport system substrate-binding protein
MPHARSRQRRSLLRAAIVVLLASAALVTSVAHAQRTLTIAQRLPFTILDPHKGSASFDLVLFHGLFDNLIQRDGNTGELHPSLARSWSVSDDGLVWTFELRDDVVFHDGTPFDAEAAAFNFMRIIDPATESQFARFEIGPLREARAVAPHTLELEFSSPYGPLLSSLSTYGMGMISPTAVQRLGAEVSWNPVGTGPYRFVSYTPGQALVVEKNPDFAWAADFQARSEPYYDTITFRFIQEDATRAAALERGEVDMALYVDAFDWLDFQANPNFVVHGYDRLGYPPAGLFINTSRAPTDDVRVRRALIHATDSQLVRDVIFEGIYEPSGGVMSTFSFGYKPEAGEQYPFDPERAGELFDEAGWQLNPATGVRERNGERLTITYLTLSGAANQAEVIEAEWRRQGIDVELLVLDNPAQQNTAQQGLHNVVWTQWGGVDPSSLQGRYGCENIGGGWNFVHYCNERVTEIFELARTETDQGVRAELFGELQDILMGDATIVPLYNVKVLVAARAGIKGFVPADPTGWFGYLLNLHE